jgi:hypothetical protein
MTTNVSFVLKANPFMIVVVPFFVRELQNNFSHPLYKENAAPVSVFSFPTTL